MNHMKLVKLLYLLDREALIRYGRPVTYDTWVSMTHGPVLSLTLDRINGQVEPGHATYWNKYISPRENHEVRLIDNPGVGQLSRAETELVDSIFATYGALNQWQLRDYCHEKLAEWQDPDGSAIPITVAEILRAAGYDEDDVREVEGALDAEAQLERLTR